MTTKLDINDLEGQAHEIWRLGEELCGDHCRSYHKLRGVLMNTSGIHGGRQDTEVLEPLIGTMARSGSRILIAGSADAGLLRTVLACAAPRPLSITVVDLCPTPLALIDSLASEPGVSVSTRTADLAKPLPADLGRFDLIFSHSMLPFVPPPLRGAVLASLRDALAPGGQLVLTVTIGAAMTDDDRREARQAWFEKVTAGVDADPAMSALAGEGRESLLRDYADRFRYMDRSFGSSEDVEALFEANGLRVEQQIYGRPMPSVSAATLGRRSAIFVTAASLGLPPA